MKRLLLLSGKGGTGKTTLSAAFVKLSQAKAVADCDVDAPNLHLVVAPHGEGGDFDFLGGDKAVVDATRCAGCGQCEANCRFGAIRVVDGVARVNEYACEGCGVCAYLCPAISMEQDIAGTRTLYKGEKVFSTATLKMGRGTSGKLVTDVKLAMLQNAPECDLAIVDGSPGIGCPVIASISGMDMVLVVAEPSESGLSDLERLVKSARTFGAKLAVCVNKYDQSPQHAEAIRAYCALEGLPFVGMVPFDAEAVQAANTGHTLVDTPSPAARAVKAIYKNVVQLLEEE